MDALTGLVLADAGYRCSAGDGSKGLRWHSWALVDVLVEPDGPDLGSLIRPRRTTHWKE